MDCVIVNMPSHYEATTGFVYLNSEDLRSEFVKAGDFVYRCLPHHRVRHGTIAMNVVQRNQVGGKSVSVYSENITSLPEIKGLYIDVEWLIRDTSKEPPEIAARFKAHFNRHVLTGGQDVLLYIDDNLAKCKVKIEGRGLMTNKSWVRVIS